MTQNSTNDNSKDILQEKIEKMLLSVYDPEFPMIDIYTLGLIYKVNLYEMEKKVHIIMSFTTPTCPMADYLIESVRNATLIVVPDWEINIEISFEPMWNPSMIRDEDLQRMFDL